MNDPLDAVFVSAEQVQGEQRALLARLLVPFAQIDPENGKVYFTKKVDELSAKRKIIVFLLARLALANRKDSIFPSAATLKEIEDGTGLPGGTVRPRLMELVRERLAMKSGSSYFVQTNGLNRIEEELRDVI